MGYPPTTATSLINGASYVIEISPSDEVGEDLEKLPVNLYVGGAGDLAVVFEDGNTDPENPTVVIFKSVPAGSVLPIRPVRIMETDTTATFILGLMG